MCVKRAVVEKDLDVVISGVVVGCYFWKLSLSRRGRQQTLNLLDPKNW